MNFITFLVIIKTIIAHEWFPYNDRFDCVVGVAVYKIPVSVGVFITHRSIITSANPLLDVTIDSVTINVVSDTYNESRSFNIAKIAGNRKRFWIPMGNDAKEEHEHTSIHDIALIDVPDNEVLRGIPPDTYQFNFLFPNTKRGRRPYWIGLANSTYYKLPERWMFTSFGYLDQEHVKNNTILEMSYTSESLADCDEWIPRSWGRFICLRDFTNMYSLGSGSPLFKEGDFRRIYGLGCFSLKKGKENLLVFTDLRPYAPYIYKLSLDGYL